MESTIPTRTRMLRWTPFVVGVIASLWVAAGVMRGRKPFSIDRDLSGANVLLSLKKTPHYASTAGIFWLAIWATGVGRGWAAFVLTMAVGAAWEIAEATAAGHTGRLADLAPDFLAAAFCFVLLSVLRGLLMRRSGAPG